MNRWFARLVVGSLVVAILATPALAFADHRGHPREHFRGHPREHFRGHPREHFWGGFAAGAVTGLVFGHVFAPPVYVAPPPVVYQPAPVYAPPPPVYREPVCREAWQPGYYRDDGIWMDPHWRQVCW